MQDFVKLRTLNFLMFVRTKRSVRQSHDLYNFIYQFIFHLIFYYYFIFIWFPLSQPSSHFKLLINPHLYYYSSSLKACTLFWRWFTTSTFLIYGIIIFFNVLYMVFWLSSSIVKLRLNQLHIGILWISGSICITIMFFISACFPYINLLRWLKLH